MADSAHVGNVRGTPRTTCIERAAAEYFHALSHTRFKPPSCGGCKARILRRVMKRDVACRAWYSSVRQPHDCQVPGGCLRQRPTSRAIAGTTSQHHGKSSPLNSQAGGSRSLL